MNNLDQDGFSPFLVFVKQFTDSIMSFNELIRQCIIWNYGKHKLQYHKYTVTNQLLYSPQPAEN